MVVYPMPRFDFIEEENTISQIPVTRSLGAYLITDPYQVSFAFNYIDEHKMLFVDVDSYNITEI